jgi:prepilin-type N-terminal cleavage/methylation domain-containing protein
MSPNFDNASRARLANRISKGTDLSKRVVAMVKGEEGKKVTLAEEARVGAFTLIELLTVIAIIGVLAGLILGAAGIGVLKSHEARMRGEHQKLMTAIEDYKAVMGNFPPDNPDTTIRDSDTNVDRHIKAGMNSLFYELSGCTFERPAGSKTGGSFTTQNTLISAQVADLTKALGVKGVENSARNKRDIPYRGVGFKPSQFAELDGGTYGLNSSVQILVTPVAGPFDYKFIGKGGKRLLNPWFYDSSSTNRHNLETYDLWSEYKAGRQTNTIGNW